MRVCVCACVRVCVRDVFGIYDNNIQPRLIMIIIKNVILYFIHITHTDDFPSTGTRLVLIICLGLDLCSFVSFVHRHCVWHF